MWIAPEIVHQPDIMAGEGRGSWEDFRKRVNRNCGVYLKSRGAKDLRGIMDEDIAQGLSRRRKKVERQQRQLDDFFAQLKEPVEGMKRGRSEGE